MYSIDDIKALREKHIEQRRGLFDRMYKEIPAQYHNLIEELSFVNYTIADNTAVIAVLERNTQFIGIDKGRLIQ